MEPASHLRGHWQRLALDVMNSSSRRGYLDAPEFPQNLPNGPVRFLGVTPNESTQENGSPLSDDKPRGIQKPDMPETFSSETSCINVEQLGAISSTDVSLFFYVLQIIHPIY